jgi:capsular exopolysaccharide synthesis family protein
VQHHNLSKIYGKKHPDILRINSQISELADLVQEEINKQLHAMENEYRKLVSLEKSYDRKLEEQKKDFIHLSNDIQKYNELKSELGIDKEMLLTVSKRLAETTLTEALETNNIRTVRMASVSVEAKPYLKEQIAVISLLTSLGLGVGLGLIMENFDKRFRSVDEAEQYLGIAFLGIVPGYKVRGNKLVALYNPDASASEAYRTVRTWIRLSSQGGIKTLLITSALAGEGKSQTAGNLAVSFAQLGQKVLLIDADLRRPQLHRTFNLINSEGLIDILVHGAEWPSVLHDTAMENLKVLTTGGRPHNPTELLSMVRMQNLLANAKDTFDLVIVDAPVMLTIPDVAILIPEMDGVLLVHDPSKGAREVVLEAKKLLDRAGANLLGMIFNNVSVKRQMHYQHTSEYYQNTYNQLGQSRRRKKSDMSFVDMRPTEGQEQEERDA